MGSAILFTAERMQAIEDGTITSGLVDVSGHLILTRHDETEVDAGLVRGDDGDDGLSAYEVWLADGNVGTVDDYLASLKGEDGETGLPAGAVMAWPTATIPDNWLECNGQAVSRTTYSDLFAIIGIANGAGDGSTTFNVPNYSGRVIVGLKTGDAAFDTMGETGGEKEHTLILDEIPVHTHLQNAHSHPQNVSALSGGSALRNDYDADAAGGIYSQGIATNATTATNQNAGGGLPHNNLQPYAVGKYIIKASGGIGVLSSTVESVLLDRVADVEEQLEYTGVNRPAFQATGTGTAVKSGAASWSKLTLTSQLMDQTACYDAVNSRFTAPVAGLYEFSFTATNTGETGGPELKLYKNGADLYGALAIGYRAYNAFGNTVRAILAAGDYVEVYWANNNGVSVTLDLVRCHFGGHYIG